MQLALPSPWLSNGLCRLWLLSPSPEESLVAKSLKNINRTHRELSWGYSWGRRVGCLFWWVFSLTPFSLTLFLSIILSPYPSFHYILLFFNVCADLSLLSITEGDAFSLTPHHLLQVTIHQSLFLFPSSPRPGRRNVCFTTKEMTRVKRDTFTLSPIIPIHTCFTIQLILETWNVFCSPHLKPNSLNRIETQNYWHWENCLFTEFSVLAVELFEVNAFLLFVFRRWRQKERNGIVDKDRDKSQNRHRFISRRPDSNCKTSNISHTNTEINIVRNQLSISLYYSRERKTLQLSPIREKKSGRMMMKKDVWPLKIVLFKHLSFPPSDHLHLTLYQLALETARVR